MKHQLQWDDTDVREGEPTIPYGMSPARRRTRQPQQQTGAGLLRWAFVLLLALLAWWSLAGV